MSVEAGRVKILGEVERRHREPEKFSLLTL